MVSPYAAAQSSGDAWKSVAEGVHMTVEYMGLGMQVGLPYTPCMHGELSLMHQTIAEAIESDQQGFTCISYFGVHG